MNSHLRWKFNINISYSRSSYFLVMDYFRSQRKMCLKIGHHYHKIAKVDIKYFACMTHSNNLLQVNKKQIMFSLWHRYVNWTMCMTCVLLKLLNISAYWSRFIYKTDFMFAMTQKTDEFDFLFLHKNILTPTVTKDVCVRKM